MQLGLRLGIVRQGEKVAFVALLMVERTGHVVPSCCRPIVKRPLQSLGAGRPPLAHTHHHVGLRPSLLLASLSLSQLAPRAFSFVCLCPGLLHVQLTLFFPSIICSGSPVVGPEGGE